ncbi:plastocyanin/azurin family copper-binding protein [Pontibacter harenae]|uniref:plastocyanin/azurin family copper-binding protein n=1 Tax=Pontibacter harenae TaxID=2894083 RepID=UPI001E5C4D32|nr:plastocyanin/azurin family copper-binding protein [Pontibacter harenae]MCC9168823.1 plastocyanin/azurin family copper-binding protein [Pontibacter harenae]
MKNTFSFLVIGFMFLAASCSSNEEAGGNSETAADASQNVQSSDLDDSTYQEVEEFTLRAVGETLEEIAFDKDTLEVNAGSVVKLKLLNEAVDMPMLHNVVFTEPGKYKQVAMAGSKVGASGNYIPLDSVGVLAATPIVLPGQTVDMEFKAPTEPGTYDFVCTYPDHWQRMHGKLIVK